MNNKAKVCIVSQSHLCRNPRVLKEALTLCDAGHSVVILTAIFSNKLLNDDLSLIEDTNIAYLFYSDLRKPGIGSFVQRLARFVAVKLQSYFKIETGYSLGYGIHSLKKRCKIIDADIYIMHQELATYMGRTLIEAGFKVAFDLEDWYSEDLLPEARRARPLGLLREAEAFALKNGLFCTTTSRALAGILSQSYQCSPPSVIYNVFPTQQNLTREEKDFSQPVKLFWFSQTVGPGRGLEEFIKLTVMFNSKFELHLLGYADEQFKIQLKSLMPNPHHLYFHQLVREQELPEMIANYDIGLALELTTPLSRNYTITNKFFQYLQSGLPVISFETVGQNEGFEKFRPGFKLSLHPTNDDINALDQWLSDSAALIEARKRAIKAAGYYNWENESKKLLNLTNSTIEHAS